MNWKHSLVTGAGTGVILSTLVALIMVKIGDYTAIDVNPDGSDSCEFRPRWRVRNDHILHSSTHVQRH